MKKAGDGKTKDVKKDDPEQSQRFVETAESLEVDDSLRSFDGAWESIANQKADPSRSSEKQSSS